MGDCAEVTGTGCAGFVDPEPTDDCGETAETGGDTAADGEVTGTGLCATTSGVPWTVLFALLFVWARRIALLALLWIPLARADDGVDAWSVRTLDGGPWIVLPDPDVGPAWDLRAAFSIQHARGLVTLWEDGEPRPLLESATGNELGASIRIAETVRIGASVLWFPTLSTGGLTEEKLLGDTRAWAAVPIHARDADGRGWDLAAIVDFGIPTGTPERWVGDPEGSIRGMLSADGTALGFDLAGSLGVRLSRPVEIPGMAWGNRLLFGVGLQHAITGPTWAAFELDGSLGLPPEMADGDLPIEALLSVGGVPWKGIGVTGGVGAGLTHGLGSPSLRIVATVDARSRRWPDTDKDGIVDIRDACVREPEDPDGLDDSDGCPEDDADADRILDPVDVCPTVPEEWNGLRDEDGCPDQAVRVHLDVISADPAVPVEQARLRVAGADPVGVAGGIDLVLPPGPSAIEVESPGFAPFSDQWDVPARPTATLTVALAPLRYGTLCATLGDDRDAPIAGTVDGSAIPTVGACFRARAGARTVQATAPGFSARVVPIELAPDTELRIHVQLERAPVWRDGSRLDVKDSVRFPLDSAEPENEPAIDAVAAWLREHPEVRLVRIEGHADATGDSAYNHGLSLRRATRVQDRLVLLGIDPTRLEVVGSGEARRPGDDPQRLVEFWVIVWGDG